ncbi:DUF2326 domain-containing protein [Aeromonas veronii]|uniref:DUF2326 domain-containing protein n=1 Tax=Aeromonas veronii TaxID=654 RepID=UPI003BA0130A
MFIKSLKISDIDGVVRNIKFHLGMNLIVDETKTNNEQLTGNNVGKTTVLKLINFCLGSDGKEIYTDPETKRGEYILVKNYLIEKKVIITLVLTSDLTDPTAPTFTIERNFLPRKSSIKKINGQKMTAEEFDEALTNILIPGHYGKKPTFNQIISHNIRYKEKNISNTLHTLNAYTRDDEYEALHLFMFGCAIDNGHEKQEIISLIKAEKAFKNKLESINTLSAYEMSLSLISRKIQQLNNKKDAIYVDPDINVKLNKINDLRRDIQYINTKLSGVKIRRELIINAVMDLKNRHSNIDEYQLLKLYEESTNKVEGIHKQFRDLLKFHNVMIEEKTVFMEKELPELEYDISSKENALKETIEREKILSNQLKSSVTMAELERLIQKINTLYTKKGELETVISQINLCKNKIEKLESSLTAIDEGLFSDKFINIVKKQIDKFNAIFSDISHELYGESYALKFDIVSNAKTGIKNYKFSSFNTNLSSGKKQGEIVCFDIAYTLFAIQENIPCFKFLLNDKKELMHDNQLSKIANLVNQEKNNVQYIASILKDKLPIELNKERYFIVKLSQDEKLFKI